MADYYYFFMISIYFHSTLFLSQFLLFINVCSGFGVCTRATGFAVHYNDLLKSIFYLFIFGCCCCPVRRSCLRMMWHQSVISIWARMRWSKWRILIKISVKCNNNGSQIHHKWMYSSTFRQTVLHLSMCAVSYAETLFVGLCH